MNPRGDVMALRLALPFANEVDFNVSHVCATHEVVAHKTVALNGDGTPV
jgi:hypothetical protein